jgi:hypothetical protein
MKMTKNHRSVCKTSSAAPTNRIAALAVFLLLACAPLLFAATEPTLRPVCHRFLDHCEPKKPEFCQVNIGANAPPATVTSSVKL